MAPALHSQPPQRQCWRDAVKSLLAPPMTLMTAMDLPTLFGLLLFTYCGIRTVSLRRMLLALQKSSTEVKYVHRQYRRCCSWSLLNVAPNSKSRRTSRTRKHPRRILWPKPSQRYCKIQRTAISGRAKGLRQHPAGFSAATTAAVSQVHHHHHHRGGQHSNEISQALNSLSAALQSNNLSNAQTAFATLQQDLQQFTEFGAATSTSGKRTDVRRRCSPLGCSSSGDGTNRN